MNELKLKFPELEVFGSERSERLGLALGVSAETQLHCGILHSGNEGVFLLHLAWHYSLKNDSDFSKFAGYRYVIPSIEADRVPAITALCRRIFERRTQIPYGVSFADTKFEFDGRLRLGQRQFGLTCATFILAVFASAGIDLLRLEEWILRTEDKAWHQQVVDSLIRTKDRGFEISEDHIANVRNEFGCARFRPQEVVGGATSSQLPSSFQYAVLAGDVLTARLYLG